MGNLYCPCLRSRTESLTISGYSGYDPEVSIRNSALTPGLDYSAYPRAYAVNFGINLGF